ncbi:MAG: GDSL-type esterase/lipase family protein [Chloroflexota bacterium]|nr:GDSL-type esterase/lipase family protein [Chloroflexota bacterium]
MFVRPTVVLSLVLALLSPVLASGSASAAFATSMAAVGDSITRAYNTGPSAYRDYPANSWSTGSSTTVYSQAVRLGIPSTSAFNDAVSGAKMSGLNAQVSAANGQGVQYVTILIGGNDVCTSTESSMTSLDSFTGDFTLAMTNLAKGSPNAKVFVASIPDVKNLWAVLKDNGTARFFWSIFGICQSMLRSPLSKLQADADRRTRVSERNQAFNDVLRTICMDKYAGFVADTKVVGATGQCLYDAGKVFATKFVASDVSTRDYFHPSVKGQTRLACVAWEMSYGGSKNSDSC